LFDSIPGTRSKAAAQFFSRRPRALQCPALITREFSLRARGGALENLSRDSRNSQSPPLSCVAKVPEARANRRLAFNLFTLEALAALE